MLPFGRCATRRLGRSNVKRIPPIRSVTVVVLVGASGGRLGLPVAGCGGCLDNRMRSVGGGIIAIGRQADGPCLQVLEVGWKVYGVLG